MSTNIICRTCEAEKPASDYYFRKDSGKPIPHCKPCYNARCMANAKANPAGRKASQDAYVERNRAAINASNSANKKANRPRVNAEQKARRDRDPKKVAEYHKAAYDKNPELFRARRRAWSATHREQEVAYGLSYAKRPEVRARIRSRAKDRLATDPIFAINHRMRTRLRESLSFVGGKNGRSWESLVGYSSSDLHAHLEAQFVKGMTWENMPMWEIDHIVALVDFNIKAVGDSEFKSAWSLSNLRPLWRPANRAKSDSRVFLL